MARASLRTGEEEAAASDGDSVLLDSDDDDAGQPSTTNKLLQTPPIPNVSVARAYLGAHLAFLDLWEAWESQ